MQLTFVFAQVTRPPKTPATKPATRQLQSRSSPPVRARSRGQADQPLAEVAEALNRGSKVAFPKNANAVRVTIGRKTIVILKADADTLKGAGIATAVEFGTVKNDAKGHPIRKKFVALPQLRSPAALLHYPR